jgi:hypothetical protein
MLDWLESTAMATWVKESWGWPLALTFHAFGNAVIIGIMFVVALRLLGFYRTIPYTAINRLIPVVWVGLVCQVASGFMLWSSKPARYLADGMFEWKLFFVIAGSVATYYFYKMSLREAGGWESAGTVSTRVVRFGAITALLWAGVLVMGRLTAYLGQLYHA